VTNLVVIAHRGASGHAPEHTFAAWDLALSQGVDYLEQDLQLTRDGALVVLHDDTLDRTVRAGGLPCLGPVRERTLAELRVCEAGSWFNQARPDRAGEYAREPVPPTLKRCCNDMPAVPHSHRNQDTGIGAGHGGGVAGPASEYELLGRRTASGGWSSPSARQVCASCARWNRACP
jgi:hypothetical protein